MSGTVSTDLEVIIQHASGTATDTAVNNNVVNKLVEEKDLLTIFTKDSRKKLGMGPMIAVLRLRNEEQVRVPVEVLATAQDLAMLVDRSIAQVQARRSGASAKVI